MPIQPKVHDRHARAREDVDEQDNNPLASATREEIVQWIDQELSLLTEISNIAPLRRLFLRTLRLVWLVHKRQRRLEAELDRLRR